MSSKTAISILVALIIFAGIFVPVVSASTQEHIVIEQINSGATDGVDLGYYTPQEGKTSVEVYPDTVTVTADGGTVAVAYPAATKTITGDAILAIGGGSASSADDLNLYIQNGKLYNSGVEYSSCTIKCVDNINQGSLFIDLVLTGAKTTYLTPLVDWAYLPTLGGAYGSYTGDLAHTLSDVVSIGDFAGIYIASKGTDIISNNEYDLSATIERDAEDNITGVVYAKAATADAAAVDGSASTYSGEDPVIIAPDDEDGTVAVLTPEEWDGEDAAASTTTTSATSGGLTYELADATATVTGPVDKTVTSITIPETVTIDNTTYTVTSIGNSAFSGCTSLTTVTLGQVINIGGYAFFGSGIVSVTIPDSVTSIGNSAFGNCVNLTSINVSSANSNYSSIDGVLYNKIGSTIFQYPAGKTNSEYIAPTTVRSVEVSAFRYNAHITAIDLSTVTNLKISVFRDCTSLTTVTLGQVPSIGQDVFSGCTSLALTSLPSNVTSIGKYAFYRVPLETLIIQSSPTISKLGFGSTGLAEVLNLGSTTLTTAMGITDRTVVSDSIESLAIVQQKQHINSYCEQKDGAVYDLVGMIPIIVLAGLAIAIVGMYAARRD